MPLPNFVAQTDIFFTWLDATNNLTSHVDNTSAYLLVAQNATPRTSTGNIALSGTFTLGTTVLNTSALVANGNFLTTLNASALATGTIPLARLTSASASANGIVDTTTQTFAGDKTFTGVLAATGGSKLVVQNGVDGTSTRGIFLWTASDSNWGLYLSQAGAGKSLANGAATSSLDARSGWHVRSRSGSLSSEGFLWENQAETPLMSLTGDTGNLYVKGNMYVGNSTSQVVLHTGTTTGINASALSTGTVPLARLDANVLLTTSTTGINASALSTGIVPTARLTSASVTDTGVVTTTTQSFAGNKTFANNVTISGNLSVLGTTTTVSANNLIVDDSLIQLAANNTTSDLLDIGLYGNYNGDGGAHEHTGLFRDATDGLWKLFVGLQDAPTSTINTSGVGYAIGTIQTYLTSGGVVANSSGLTVTANNSYSGTLTVNTVTAQTLTGNLTGTASNATNLNSQPGSYYTNASNLNTGTVPIARLDANVILTTSTTGINASALSTGTVPLARLTSANSSANGVVDTNTQTFAGNKTFQNVTTFSNTVSINSSVGIGTANPAQRLHIDNRASGSFGVAAIRLASGDSTGSWNTSDLKYTKNTTHDQIEINLGGAATSQFIVRNSPGNVGIGNTSPAHLLRVEGTTSINGAFTTDTTASFGGAANALGTLGVTGTFTALGQMVVGANANFDSGVLFVDSVNNRVGVNNTAPTTALEVTGTVTATTFSGSGASLTALNASNLSTGTVPIARLDANVILTTSTTGINASALSTGTVPVGRLDSSVLLTTSTTGINASALSTGTVPIARLDGNVILTTSTTGINASALSTGTVPVGRLDSSVLLTTSTTGINASALSTGTVPVARLSSANTTAAGVVDTTTQSFAGNKTFQNAATFSSTVSVSGAVNALSTLGVTGTLTALGQLSVTGNATFDTNTLFVDATNDTVGMGTTETSSESNLFLGARGTDEGGQITLQRATNRTTAFSWDNYQDTLRVLTGNNTISNAAIFSITATGNTSISGTLNVTGAVNTLSTLGVTGTLSALGQLSVTGNATFDTNTLFVDAVNNRVGVNNSGPTTALDVTGTVTATTFSGSGASLTTLNASALSTGTVPVARLDSSVILTTSTTGINASALSTGTVPVARLSSANTTAAGVVDTTTQSFAGNKTFTNDVTVSGTLTGTLTGTASNATNLNSQPGSYYTNASNLSTGTLPVARLDSNVILTTTTTGINASALSTGTVPVARLDSSVILTTSTTGINASALSTGTVPLARLTSANSSANGVVDTNTQTFAGLKTFSGNATFSGSRTFFASGSVLDWNSGDVTLTHAADKLTIDSGSLAITSNVSAGLFTGLSITNITTDQSGVKTRISLPVFNGTTGGVIEEIGNSTDGYRLNIYQGQTSGSLTLGTGGDNARLHIISSGNIGIGNTTPAHLLRVEGTTSINGALNALSTLAVTGATTLSSTLGVTGVATFSANANFDSGTLFVDGVNNRVGINNTAPTTALEVTGTVTATTFSGSGASLTSLNASALSTGTVPVGRLDSSVILTTSTTGINASALSVGTVPVARLDSSVLLTTSTTGINASALSTGTVPVGRLDSSVLLTTSTTGINASALSTGTVPTARLTSASASANGVVDTTTQTFAGNKTFNNDVTIAGTLTLLGQGLTLNTNNIIVQDSLIQLAANNTTSDALDIGLYGNYNGDGGAHEHTGLFRDATDGLWKLFVGLQDAPTNTTINIAGTGYAVGTLQTYLTSGGMVSNSTAFAVTANSSYTGTLTVNSVTAQTLTGNLTGTASNATNLNSQPGSFYTNASNLNTGTVPVGRLDSSVLLTTSTTGINASALSTGTVPVGRLDSSVLLTTSTTGINASALSTGTVPVGRLDSSVILTTTTTGINASALSVGTVPVARLDSSVLLTTSTTGINASALSVGTVPVARLDSSVILTTSTTGINASALSVGTVPVARLDSSVILTTSTTGINASALSTGTVPVARLSSANTSAAGVVDTTTQTFAGNKTFQNTVILQSALTANSGNGSAGQVLTSNGAGVYWANASAGAVANTAGGTGALQFYNGTTLGADANLAFLTNTLTVNGGMTVAANANFNGGTLFVDTVNNRVGIGNTAPASRLVVSDAGNYQLGITGTSTTAYTQLYLNGTNRAYGVGVGGGSETAYGVPDEFFIFDHTAGAMRLVLDTSGNVGLGNTSPAHKLRVEGTTSISGALNALSTFAVTGATTLSSTLGVTGVATFSANANFDSGVLFVDGVNNRVGVNNAAPTQAFRVDGTTSLNGNVAIGTTNTSAFALLVEGSFAATTKEFNIAHPTRPGKRLRYGVLESPYHGVRLTGRAELTGTEVEVPLPDYLSALCTDVGSQVQLTNHGHDKVLWVDRIDLARNCFVVRMRRRWWDRTTYAFYWAFTGIRQDVEPLDVEPE